MKTIPLFSLIFLTVTSANLWAEPSAIAKTLFIKPSVSAQPPTTERIIERGDSIYHHDIIHTQTQARAKFRFDDGTLLTMGENSVFAIKEFVSTKQKKHAVFEFTQGAFRILTGSITDTSSPSFTVNTPMGSIGIRGTDFWGGNLSDDGSIDVLLIDSEHTIEVSNSHGKVVLRQAGEGTTLKPNMAPLTPKIWPQAKVQKALNTINLP